MTFSQRPLHGPPEADAPDPHPLLALANAHLRRATAGLMNGRFSPLREIRDPKRMLVVYRKRYGGDVVGDEYFVAEPTYIRGPLGGTLRVGETIVVDFQGSPAVAVVEALLYRALLRDDPG
jgi:hypothetical protein